MFQRACSPLLVVPLALVLLALPVAPAAQGPPADLVIRGARLVDGTGAPWYRADVAVRGDTILAIARGLAMKGTREVDASGLVLAPGFIDLHTHARRGLFEVPTADNYVRQGVTTVIEGPDGSSPIPLGAFLDNVAATRVSVNVGAFIGQGSVRARVVGEVDRPATAAEVETMRALVRAGMRDGAFGLSTGLFYVPGTFTPTAEVVELAKVAGQMGGLHVSHMRDEAQRVVESVRETIAIGEQGALPTQVTHHKIIGRANWGKSVETLRLVAEARARGVDVTIDQYPYTASSTSVQAALLPAWAQDGGRDAVMKRLGDPATRARIRAAVVALIENERGGGDPQNVQIANCTWDAALAGQRLGDITRGRGGAATVDAAADTVLWIVEQGGCQGIFHAIAEDDLVRILTHPATMIASDGEIPIFGRASPHPRSYGTFVRVLGRYVRERGVLTLEDAVRKMTSFPAQRLGLTDRGVVRPGLVADLVLFDPSRVADRATFEQPHQYAEGIAAVIVNGEIVFEHGAMTPARPGRVLRGPAFER
jgi:dihydroorotase/N-acyl-D-amino-acid deacylase